MTSEALHCPTCGGPLERPSSGETYVECRFCGTTTSLGAPPAPARVARAPAPALARPARPRSRAWTRAALLVVACAGVATFVVARRASRSESGSSRGAAAEPDDRVLWDLRGDSVLTRDLDGDGVEDVIGRERPQSADATYYVAAHDGVSGKRLWRIGPIAFGECGVPTALAGKNWIAFADCKERLHVHAIDTRAEVVSLPTSDRVTLLCGNPAADELYLETADERAYGLDGASKALVPAKARPAWCAPHRYQRPATLVTGAGERSAPTVDGFEVAWVMVDDGVHVAIEGTKKGTARAVAVGFDAPSSSIRWVQSLFDGSPDDLMTDMAAGKVVFVYPRDAYDHFDLLALDARTGARAWGGPVASDHVGNKPELLSLTGTRVYLEGRDWLHVLDLGTGASLLRLGN